MERLIVAAGGHLAPKRSATHVITSRVMYPSEAEGAGFGQEVVDQNWLFTQLVEGGMPSAASQAAAAAEAEGEEDEGEEEEEEEAESDNSEEF